MSTASSYERWGHVHTHAGPDGLRTALEAGDADGVHQLALDDEVTLDVLVQGSPEAGTTSSIPVFFNGNVPSREEKSGPFFSGGRVGPAVSPVYAAISDPAVDRDSQVRLGWYAGFDGADVTAAILDALRALSDAWRRELVLVGGSGGGFAALRYAALLDRPVSALVWNPQTDILRYNRTFVDQYLQSAFAEHSPEVPSAETWLQERTELCARAGIEHSLVDRTTHDPSCIDRLLYLQNLNDWHLSAHAMPYVQAHRFQDLGTGSRILGPDHVVQGGDWGAGHAPLTHDLLVSALAEFLHGDAPSLDIARRIVLDEACDAASLAQMPKDLRSLATSILTGARAAHATGESAVTVTLPEGAPEPGYGGLRFGLTQSLGDRRGQLAWFRHTRRLEYDADARWTGSELLVTVRDGLNHHLGQLAVGDGEAPEPAVVRSPVQSRDPAQTRAFIYGSCVTRDAFALDGAPGLSDYFARTPLVSAFGRAPAELPASMDLEAIPSAFQKRMVDRDVRKTLPPTLRDLDPEVLVIIDLIDERIPVARVSGGILACSSEAARAGFAPQREAQISIGRPGFITAWNQAAAELVEALEGRRVVLNKAYWATHDDTGQDLQERFPIELHNRTLKHMYTTLERSLGCAVIEYPDDLLVADSTHRWGLSPFHYTRPFYDHFIARLREVAS
ncbi:DUF6270 domain-containing protein [Kocuria palustris]|uniref:DUF6270 domain-containing protein n=1 Tax=Kocuria palustris TaxID=71999 RepID=UPI00119F140F|nr:DUF6270 domain-containing protein [Kocuria palustris]